MTSEIKSATEAAKAQSVQMASASVTLTNYQQVKGWLTKGSIRDAFMEVLGDKYAPRYMQTVLQTMNNPNLKKCDPATIVRSAMVSACVGLTIDPNLSQAALIPYKDQCTFQIMRRGLQQLAYRSGGVSTFNSARVYEGDILSHNPFTGEYVYNQSPHEQDIAVGFIAYIKLLNGFEKYTYMTDGEVMAWGQRYSKSYGKRDKYGNYSSMWQTDFCVMADKTVSKRAFREGAIIDPYANMPMNNLATALKFDNGVPSTDGPVDFESPVEYPDGQSEEEAMAARVSAE